MKTIEQITNAINAQSNGYEIGGLQDLRKELHNLSRRPGSRIFSEQTITPHWAFHHGGRSELQFNIGFDGTDGEALRHGIAFSFRTSQTLPDIAPLREKAALFNEYLRLNPEEFADLNMWYWDGEERSEDMLPAPVASDLIREGVFLFLGTMQPIADVTIPGILADFDALLPLYTFVEGGGYSGTAKKKSVTKGFHFESGCTFKKLKAKSRPKADPVDISLRHNAMQHKLFDRLAAKHGADSVGTEIATGNGTRIDVAVRTDAGYRIYEIKPYQSPRACIRDALGQLLEYAHWQSEFNAIELVVVGPKKVDDDARKYLKLLRDLYQLPISYLQVAA
ncbi:hypothetical protein [Roseimaritima sediminicola]|uniref:hypothetical protein n=1 Tax=Roseimaritima sediminicola TaxID=2662066 RepID=UPI0012983D51|nr:hypothetical protein [Roseimaritima sediminicola]